MLNQKAKSKAFTIVELLTVISVITLIIGLLVPALNKVNRIAKDMKQKAQFHSITTALEMFKSENGEYPASKSENSSPNIICGAHKLAEALLGRDLQGFDTLSSWDAKADETTEAYYNETDKTKVENSLDRRKGPYLTVDNASAYDIAQIYKAGTGAVYPGRYDNTGGDAGGNPAPVITDIYKSFKVTLPNTNKAANAGTPILYYKANVSFRFNDSAAPASSIYNIEDNDEIVILRTLKDQNIRHKIEDATSYDDDNNPATAAIDGFTNFYNLIKNNVASANLTGNLSRPYRPDSYILISAGFDGVYGTNDDITNYEE